MKVTHYAKKRGASIVIYRYSDQGKAFTFPDNEEGRMRVTLLLRRLFQDYDRIFWVQYRHLQNKGLLHLIKREHYPDKGPIPHSAFVIH